MIAISELKNIGLQILTGDYFL